MALSHEKGVHTLSGALATCMYYPLLLFDITITHVYTGILIQDIDIPTDVEEPADLADGNVRG